MVQAPIFHVNGDDPEAAVRVDAARVRVPPGVPEGRRRRPRLLPPLRPQRGRRARVHAAARCTRSSTSTPRCARSTPQQLVQRGDITPDDEAGRRVRLPGPARPRVRGDPRRARTGAGRRRRRRPLGRRPTSTAGRRPAGRHRGPGATCSTACVDGLTTWPDGFDVNPKLERQLLAAAHDVRRATRSTGRWPRRSRSVRWCSRARRCASRARTPGGARSASATACSSTSAPKREYVPARAPRRRPGAVHALRHRAVGVRRARVRVRLLDRVRTRWCAGRRSSATSPTARRS